MSHNLHNYIAIKCAKSGTTFQLAKAVDKWLYGYHDIAIAVIVCACSINVKLPPGQHQRCNLFLVLPAGQGKTSLLDCLLRNNPRMFVRLREKMYESILVTKGNEFFHRKVLLHNDMAIGLGGLRKQQSEQLLGFFTGLLSDGQYSREHHMIQADTCAVFGIALNNYRYRRGNFATSTFSDRFGFFLKDIPAKDKEAILQESFTQKPEPKLKLPYLKHPVSVAFDISEEMRNAIIRLAMELDTLDAMTANRAKNFIRIFMQSNALLNNRKYVLPEDLIIYSRIVHPYLKSSSQLFEDAKLLNDLQDEGKSKEEVLEKTRWSRSKYYRVHKALKALSTGQ